MTNKLIEEGKSKRETEYPVDDLIVGRWSPRSMSGEELSDEELLPLLEAAKWAASSYNEQPWRFVIAKRNTPQWEPMFGTLVEMNQAWAKNAAALILVTSNNNSTHNGKPYSTHSLAAGAATANLETEGAARDLVVHGMEGFDHDKIRALLKIPDDVTVEAMYAVGKHGKKENMPEQMQKMESPSGRKPLKELVFKGEFGKSYFD